MNIPIKTPGWFARTVNIPNVNNARRGPPTTPNIVSEACRIPPRCCAANAMARQTNPYEKARI